MINDFRNSHAFIDYRVYGSLTLFDASFAKGEGGNDAGEIVVFLNFRIVGRFKAKQQALACVKKLISEAPPQARLDFEAHQSILLENLMPMSYSGNTPVS